MFHEALDRFRRCAIDACPRVVREDCRQGLAGLRDAPWLTVRVRDTSGRDLPASRIEIDGTALSTDEATQEGRLLDAGSHTLHVTGDGRVPDTRTLVIAKTDPPRTVDVMLREREIIAPRAPNRTPAVVVGAAGLIGLGVFAVFGTWSFVDYQRLSHDCPRCSQADIDAASSRAHVGDVALLVGAGALVAGAVLWFTARTDAPPRAAMLVW
jgi:hypothetical protein